MKKLLFVLFLGAFLTSCGTSDLGPCEICYVDVEILGVQINGTDTTRVIKDTRIKGIFCEYNGFTVDDKLGPIVNGKSYYQDLYGTTFNIRKNDLIRLKGDTPTFDCNLK